MKSQFNDFYSSEIDIGLKQGLKLDQIKVDLSLSNLKNKHGMWIVNAVHKLKANPEAGLGEVWDQRAVDKTILAMHLSKTFYQETF